MIFVATGFYHISEEPAIEIHPNHASFYQERPCNYSVYELLNQDYKQFEIVLLNSPDGSVECFGKNSWYEYVPEKLIENGWDEYESDYIKIWLSTNINLDLIVQSLFWFILLSFIPVNNSKKFKKVFTICSLNTLIFYLHLLGEGGFYKNLSREYDIEFISREFNGDLYFENYFLYLYVAVIFLISYLFLEIGGLRFGNLLNYLPFVFLIYGTYSSLNLNFYLIILCLIGLHSVYEKKVNYKLTIIYFMFSIFWIVNLNEKDLNFDVDKLRGFINSSQSTMSIIFWIITYFLIINGMVYIVKESKEFFNPKLFRKNLLIASSLILLFGVLSGINKLFNYLSYYFLGLNKFGMRSLESIEGNTWRGIAPSAEGMGEFYAFVLLFSVIYSFEKKIKFNFFEIFLVIFPLLGLIRSNNFAAISSSILILLIYFLSKKFKSKGIIFILIFFIASSSVLVYSQYFREFSYNYLSSNILYEGLQASEIEYKMETNQFGYNQAENANYQYILEIPEDEANLSSSLRFLISEYTYGKNIKNLPSAISVLNVGSYFINRSEKWGIFFAKYDPGISEFLFGYGPQQLTNYYFDHGTKYNFGLFLPHSSVLNYLLFFGFFGLLFILGIQLKILYKYKDPLNLYFIAYFFLNFIKSDSLLYLPNLIFIIFISNFYLFNPNKRINA